jgi:hypothetical protein
MSSWPPRNGPSTRTPHPAPAVDASHVTPWALLQTGKRCRDLLPHPAAPAPPTRRHAPGTGGRPASERSRFGLSYGQHRMVPTELGQVRPHGVADRAGIADRSAGRDGSSQWKPTMRPGTRQSARSRLPTTYCTFTSRMWAGRVGGVWSGGVGCPRGRACKPNGRRPSAPPTARAARVGELMARCGPGLLARAG